jgi:hypothetical protein
MQEAKATGGPAGPIVAHAGVHAVLVGFAVGLVSRPGVLVLLVAVLLEFVTHLAIDWGRGRLGARRPLLGDAESQAFWVFLGIDQLAHYLVLLWITLIVV